MQYRRGQIDADTMHVRQIYQASKLFSPLSGYQNPAREIVLHSQARLSAIAIRGRVSWAHDTPPASFHAASFLFTFSMGWQLAGGVE